MSKTLKFMSLLLVTLLGFSACSNDSILDEGQGKGNTITFTLDGAVSPTTRATASPDASNPTTVETPALDREKAVSTIYAVLFSNGQWLKTVQATGSGTYTVDAELEGTFDMYLVANPDAALVTQLESGITNVASYEQLIATQTPGDNNTATNFLMTSAKKSVTTTASTTTNIGAIKLVRLSARFDLYNRVPKLEITKITMNNRFVQSRISRGALNASMEGLNSNSTTTYEAAQGLKAHECVAAMYSYENMFVGGTSLTIEGTYEGQAIKPFNILLESLPVKRNHLYSIILSPKDTSGSGGGTTFDPNNVFGSVSFNIVVKDWEEGETIEWTGANALSTVVPAFTASATANLTEAGTANPTALTVTNAAANTVTLTVTGVAAGSVLVHTEGTLPEGYQIAAGSLNVVSGVPTQTFTITLPQNTTYTKELPFELQNALDPEVKRSFTLSHQGVRAKLPIEYIVEYNVATDGMSFATSHENDKAGGWFTYADAVSKFTSVKIDQKPYHLPSVLEWRAVVAKTNSPTIIRFQTATNHTNVSEEVVVKGVTATYTADYKGTGNNICYAVRFKGNGDAMKCAYRYERVGSTWTSGSLDNHLKVTVRYLGPSSTTSLTDVADEAYWSSNNSADIVRYFAAMGADGLYGTGVHMHSSTLSAKGMALPFTSFIDMFIYEAAGPQSGRAVRLFSDK